MRDRPGRAATHVAGPPGILVRFSIPLAKTSEEGRMKMELTAVFRKVPQGYVGFIEELPGANTQGATLDEARANLREAVVLVLEANRAPLCWQGFDRSPP